MQRFVLSAALAAACLCGPALAAPEDNYVALKTALEIDLACGGLKYVESAEAGNLAYQFLAQAPQSEKHRVGLMPDADYKSWLAALDQRAADAAAAVGCTQQAMQYVMPAKGAASEIIYRGLVLAFYFDAHEDFLVRSPLDEHQKRTASGYDAYLQQLYRENFQAFSEAQKHLAMQELPVEGVDIFGDYDALGSDFDDGSDIFAYMTPKSLAYQAMNAVQFEVTAEANRYLVRPRRMDESVVIPELRDASGVKLPVIDGPGYRLVTIADATDSAPSHELYSVTVVRPDGGLRVMFYGTTATGLTTPTVRLYVRNQPWPDGATGWETFKRQTFREEARAFDGVRADDACLGAPCYDFPLEASAAMVANAEGDLAELFVAAAANAVPPEITSTTTDRKYLDNRLLLRLVR